MTYTPPDARWSLTGFARNINDGHPYTFSFVNSFANTYVGNIGAPRTYGARVAVKF